MADSATNPAEPVKMEGDVIVEFNEASSRQQINSGESVKTLFGKLKKFLTDLKAVAFSGAYSDLSGVPDLTQYASKSKYGDTTINVGRKSDTDVGNYSTAEGKDSIANGYASHAEGYTTTASGSFSHSEGDSTTASGNYSHAEGQSTTASGADSHAEGIGTTASGDYSHAGGGYTKALHIHEVAYGQYNESNDDTLFSVGDGTADNARHNAFEITTTGGKLHDKDIAVKDDISNPNLLINPDFKINQRGNTSFTVSYHTGSPIPQSQLYTVDRWRLMDGKADILEGKFVLNGTIIQVLENGIGENFTASVSVESGAATASYDDGTKTFTIVGDAAVLNWAKLEHGGTATQFIPPDPATELVKCKRYYRAFGANFNLNTVGRYYHNKNNQFTYYLDVPMRVNPDVIFTDCGVKLVSEPYSDIEVNSYNSLSTKYALFVYCTMDNLYDDAMFYVKSENGLKLDAEIK